MSSLAQLRGGLDRAWETLQAGWRTLVNRTSDALTRFLPEAASEQDDAQARELRAASPGWGLLAAEVREEDDAVVVRLEAPGLEPGQFDIAVEDQQLLISGEKCIQREQQRGHYLVTERAYGRFQRLMALPTRVEADQARAEYRRGVLTVTLPKHASARTRQIPVHSR